MTFPSPGEIGTRIVVVGAGGLGCRLAAALARRHDVAVMARGASRHAIAAGGIALRGPDGGVTVSRVRVVDRPALEDQIVLVAVKSWQVGEVANLLRDTLGRQAVVIPTQNGLHAAQRLGVAVGDDRVLGGVAHMLSWMIAPGVIGFAGPRPALTIGARLAEQTGLVERAAAALRGDDLDVTVSAAIEATTWAKLLFVEPFGAVSALARAPIGVVRTEARTRALLRRAMEEVADIAAARGIVLPANEVDAAMDRIDGLPDGATSSLYRDILAERPSELDELTGAVVAESKIAGVDAPVHEVMWAALSAQERAARKIGRG